MEDRSRGKNGLTVSVAGLGCGGNSRRPGPRARFDDAWGRADGVDLGVNFLGHRRLWNRGIRRRRRGLMTAPTGDLDQSHSSAQGIRRG